MSTFDQQLGGPPLIPKKRHPLSHDVRNGTYPHCPPELAHLVAAEDQLDQYAEGIANSVDTTFAQFLGGLTTDLIAGEPLPVDLIARAREITDNEENLRIAALTIGHLQANIGDRWVNTARRHADTMLAGLRGDLEEIVAETRGAAAELGSGVDPTNPEAVAEASSDQREALAALKALRTRYRTLRGLQTRLVETAIETPFRLNNSDAERYRWAHVWQSRVHEFQHGNLSGGGHHVLWFRDLQRPDVWLPDIDDLRDAWFELGRPTIPR